MTDRALEALIAKWREREKALCRRSDAQSTSFQYTQRLAAEAEGIARCADELEALLQQAAAVSPVERVRGMGAQLD
jgi:hypothetical protein